MLFNNVILAALPLSLCVAAPSERQVYVGEGASCKVRGDHQNVRPYAFLQDKTVPACRKLCKRDADCRSFATYKHACRLYDVSVRANVEESDAGPWTFYDKTCNVGHERRQASGSSTTRSTISTTTSRAPAPSTTTSRTPAPSTTTSRTTVSTTTRPGSTSDTAATSAGTSSYALPSSVATTVVGTSAATSLSNTLSNSPPVVSTSLLTSASLSVSSTFVTVSTTAGSASSSTSGSSELTTLPATSVASPSTTAISPIEQSSLSVVGSSSAPGSSSSSLSPSSDSVSIAASSSTTILLISSTMSTSSLPATTSGSVDAQREVRNVKLIIGSSSANKRAAPRYLSRLLSADGSRGLTDNPDDALLIAFAFPLGSTQPVPQLNLFTLNSASDLNYPFLSMVMRAADAASAIIGSNVASIVAFGASQATAPGATPQSVGNSVSDRDTGNSYFVESAIWTVDPLTFAIKATWVNPDGQPNDLTLVTNGDAVGLTAAPQLLSGWQSVSMAADVPPNDGADTTTSGLAVESTSAGQVQVSSTTATAPMTTIDTQPVTTSDAPAVSTTDVETSSSDPDITSTSTDSLSSITSISSAGLESTTAAITSETITMDAPVTSSQSEAVVATSTGSVTTTTSGPSADVVCCFDITPGMCPRGQNGAELYNPGAGYDDENTCGQGCFNDPRCIGWQYSTRFGCSFWNAGSDGAGTFAPYYNSGQCRDNTVAVKRPTCGSVCGAPTTTLAVAPSTTTSLATTTDDVDQSTSTTTVESEESSSANGTPAVTTTTTSAAVVSTPGPVGACGVKGDPIYDLGEISNAFVTSVQSCARSCWSNTNCASYSIDQITAVDNRKRTIFYTCRLLRAPFASNIAANDNGARTFYSRSCAAPISTLCGAKANPTADLSFFDTQLVPNLAQCAAMCVQRSACQSYSITDSNGGFDGWAKRDTTTTYRCSMYTDAFADRATADPSSSTTFYERSCAPAPPTTLNMVCNAEGSVPQTDLQYIDQSITDADTCYSTCIANPSCMTYSFRRIDMNGDFSGYCVLFAQQIQYSDFYYFPTRNYWYQRDCAPPSEFAFKQYSRNIAGTFQQFQGPYCNKQIVMKNDMEKIYATNMFTQQACGNACLAQTYCQSFSFDQTSNICTLFGDPLAEYASPGTTGPIFSERECLTITTTTTTTSAVQTTTTTTTTAAATTTAAHVCAQNGRTASGFYSYWNRQLQTPAQCQAYCAADAQCQAFSVYTYDGSNFYCDLYSHPLPASYSPDPSSGMIWTERACFVSGDASATTTAAPPAGTPGPMLCDVMGRQGSLYQLGYEGDVDNLAGCKARCAADVLCRSYSFRPPQYEGDNWGNKCSMFSSALSNGFEQWERLDGTYYYDLACDLNATPTTTTISRTKPIMDHSSMPQVPMFRAPADAPNPIPSDYPPIDSSATRYCDGMENGPYNVTWWDQSVDNLWVEFDVRCSTLMDWTGTVVERRNNLGFAACMEYCRVKGSDCDAVMWGETLNCAILAFSDRQLYASSNNAFAKRIAWGDGWNDQYTRKRSLKTIG